MRKAIEILQKELTFLTITEQFRKNKQEQEIKEIKEAITVLLLEENLQETI